MALTTVPVELANLDGAVTVNESSADVDFRIESNGNANMLFVDGGSDRVGIGTNSPSANLEIEASSADAEFDIDSNGGSGRRYRLASLTDGKFEIKDKTANSSRMTIDSAGRVTMPLQPAFLVKLDGDQNNITNTHSSNITIEFDDEIFDVGNNFGSNQFTAPVTGKYLLTYSLRTQYQDSSGTISFSVIMETSNRNISQYADMRGFDADPTYYPFTYAMVHDMDAGDTAKITVYQDGTTTQADISQYSYFSGQLIS